MRWRMKETDANLELMSKTLGITKNTANVMANRNLRTKKTALSFLSPSIDNFHDTLEMKGMEDALRRLSQAVSQNEKTVVFGDYDADGIMSVVIMYRVLKRLGADVSYYIPHRQKEGYGLNKKAVESLAVQGFKLIIAVDNGISATEEVGLARQLGVDTIIIDHHEPGGTLPPAVSIIDPKQDDCIYPFKEMCAAGLVYKTVAALCELLNDNFMEREEMLALAAVATLCDIVDLVDENRILVNCGLVILNNNKLINAGLGSLITLRGYLEKPIDTFTVGFVLGPCLNAAGRLESANLSVELLLSEDFKQRVELAHKLADLNEDRKNLTSDCVDRVLEKIDMEALDRVLVISDITAHESIAGIVAGRIREATNRPTILLTRGDGAMKGSGRSIPGYNLFEALYSNKELFLRFGGHAMAAGLTIFEENIPALREVLNKECKLTDFEPVLEIDCELKIEDVTLAFSDELTCLAPFGKGNDEPLFLTKNAVVENVRVIDEKRTIIFTFYSPTVGKVKGIAFGLNDMYAARIAELGGRQVMAMDVVYGVETNFYNGVASVQMRVRDFRLYAG